MAPKTFEELSQEIATRLAALDDHADGPAGALP